MITSLPSTERQPTCFRIFSGLNISFRISPVTQKKIDECSQSNPKEEAVLHTIKTHDQWKRFLGGTKSCWIIWDLWRSETRNILSYFFRYQELTVWSITSTDVIFIIKGFLKYFSMNIQPPLKMRELKPLIIF